MTGKAESEAELSINMSPSNDEVKNDKVKKTKVSNSATAKPSQSNGGKVTNSSISCNAVPKFTDNGHCAKCKSTNVTDECISCSICDNLFHAVCYSSRQGKSKSICSKTFLDAARPIIAKYGSHAERWGNFIFVCKSCSKMVDLFKTKSQKKFHSSSVQTEYSTCDISVQATSVPNSHDNSAQTLPCQIEQDENNPDHNDSISMNDIQKHMEFLCIDMKNSILADIDEMLDNKLCSMSLTSDVQAGLSPGIMNEPVIPEVISASTPDIPDISDDQLTSALVNVKLIVDLPEENSQSSSEIPSSLQSPDIASDETPTFANMAANSPSTSSNLVGKEKLPIPTGYIQAVSNDEGKNDSYVIVLSSNQNTNICLNDSVKVISKQFKSIPLNFIKINENKRNIVVSFPSEKLKETGKMVLNASNIIKEGKFEISDGKKMFPKITVSNIPNSLVNHIVSQRSDITVSEYRAKLKECLLLRLLEKNESINDYITKDKKTFELIYVNVGKEYSTIGIKLSPIIRNYIMKTKSIFIGNTKCKVSDRVDIKQCFKCQRIGHMSTNCTEPNTICMYCGASHLTHQCPNKQNKNLHRCTNCSRSKNPAIQQSCHTHHSGSEKCPIIALERANLVDRTEYSKNI